MNKNRSFLLPSLCLVMALASLHFCPVALAQEPEEGKSREEIVKESIANIDSTDIRIATQAALYLGIYKATEGVPAMLRVLQSSRYLTLNEHIRSKDRNGMSIWITMDVRAAIVESLGSIGDRRAVPVLEKYLKKPPKNAHLVAQNVVHALYRITGKSYRYKDLEGKQKLYEPSPVTEEEVRMRLRPDLTPTDGLTAALEIPGHDPSGTYWLGNHSFIITLEITNHTKTAIELDAHAENFVFSSVVGSGARTNTPATSLSAPEPAPGLVRIQPGEKFRLKWTVETLKDSPLARGWAGFVNIKCVYTNPRKREGGASWRGRQLISNSVERAY
ncbi:MAG TPA: hypothetical protein VN643_17795 [Pyrinomonadaceae bacterium]|nr:hypothetical protein [Pyrinomonadaceae bacterium]